MGRRGIYRGDFVLNKPESEEKSRTEYSARNMTVAVIAQALSILAGFCTRMVFTHTLSREYAGVNGLFSNILSVLALSELGAGAAITYALYKPIAAGDIEKQKSLMRVFRRFYRLVALVIFTGGLTVIPFMDLLMKNRPDIDHLVLIYLLYLSGAVSSYLMTHKRMLIETHQLSYICVLYQTGSLLAQYALQVVVLLTSGNFLLYISIATVCTILNNLAISRRADKLYPFLRDRDIRELPEGERREIVQNTRALLLHKIGGVAVNNTDNLLLSSLVGLTSNGLYSNYYLIIHSIRQVLNQTFQGLTASVGNLGAATDPARVRRVFEATFFMGQWMFGLAAICIAELIDPVVALCFGPSYVFSRDITLILCVIFYLTGMRQATMVFRNSLGIFWYDRYKPLAEAAINLGASIVLGLKLGTAGVFLGTIISTVATSLWVEPLMLYRHFLHVPARSYFLRYGLYASVTALLWYGEDLLCRGLGGGVWAIALRLAVCVTVTNLAYLLLYHRTKEFQLLLDKGRLLLERRLPGWFRR